jgi:NitT/TauT family transport system substrate-binding protein
MQTRSSCLHLSRRQLLQQSGVGLLSLAATRQAWAAGLTPIRMACWSQPLSEQTNIFAAQEFGWFKDVGLEFKFVPGAGGGAAVKHLLAGNADIAFANIEPLLFAVERGSDLKAVYNIYPQNVFNVVSLKTQNITKPEDLKGKKIGVYSMESGTRHNLRIMLRAVGLDESNVDVIPTGVLNFAPLMQGQVDATAATDTGLWLAQQRGLGEVNIIEARDYLNTPTDVFIVTSSFYETRQHDLKGFLQAYKHGTQWMMDHPDQAAEMAQKYAINGKDPKQNLEIIKIRNASSVSDGTREHGLGWFDIDLLVKVEQTFRELDLIKKQLDMRDIFTNELVPTR